MWWAEGYNVEIKVKEVFTDVSDLLEAERDNGFQLVEARPAT